MQSGGATCFHDKTVFEMKVPRKAVNLPGRFHTNSSWTDRVEVDLLCT